MPDETPKTTMREHLGRVAYEAYAKTSTENPASYDDANDEQKAAWENSAAAVVTAHDLHTKAES